MQTVLSPLQTSVRPAGGAGMSRYIGTSQGGYSLTTIGFDKTLPQNPTKGMLYVWNAARKGWNIVAEKRG